MKVGDNVSAEGDFLHGNMKSHLINPSGTILKIEKEFALVELGPWYVIPRTRWFYLKELKKEE